MKKIGILTSGVDAPFMKTCIRAAVRTALDNNLEISGIRRAFPGFVSHRFYSGGPGVESQTAPRRSFLEGELRTWQLILQLKDALYHYPKSEV
jgi:hypothetical protein